MQVEIFHELEESGTQHPECNQESLKILEELGLTLQIEKYSKKDNVVEQIFPFKQASMEELFTYHMNFNQTTELGKFNAEVIPLRVLEVIKKAKETGRFTKFQVWHKEPAFIKEDPIIVGVITEREYYHSFYLIARWGDSLLSYLELKKKAIELYTEEMNETFANITLALKQDIEAFGKGKIPELNMAGGSPGTLSPYYSGIFR